MCVLLHLDLNHLILMLTGVFPVNGFLILQMVMDDLYHEKGLLPILK